MVKDLKIFPDPILREKCTLIPSKEEIPELIKDMFDTMYAKNGCGLAAPQIGLLYKVFIMNINQKEYVLIDPEIIETSERTIKMFESCLSIPGRGAVIERPSKVKMTAYDANMEKFTLTGEGLMGRCMQHEKGHLLGQLFTDLIE